MQQSRLSTRVIAIALVLTAFGSCAAAELLTTPACPPSTQLPKGTVVCFGAIGLHAELATTFAERQQGLMNRPALPDTAGMLFVFAINQELSFWMVNTPSPLSIAFLDSTKTIINIEDMEPNTSDGHRSNGLARYALEVRRGWFADRGIRPGSKATFTLPPGLPIDP
ncbi:MAG TPA: DUF192 domain-containing protein [Gemmatimonadaceae bacterium]|nr:DUF192 domain-containing protein [Gemmatimonadaceae bacterium]